MMAKKDENNDDSTSGCEECIDVAIIGCGFAGLGAAHQFHCHDFHDFVVLEARDRIGGRVVTSYELPGPATTETVSLEEDEPSQSRAVLVPVDLGAGWIHHIRHNPVYETALRLNVPCEANYYSHQFFRDAEASVDPTDRTRYRKFRKEIWNTFVSELDRKQKQLARDIKDYGGPDSSSSLRLPLKDFSLRQFANEFVEQNPSHFSTSPNKEFNRIMFESVLHLAYVGEYAANLKYLSFLKFDDDVELKGSDAYLSLKPVAVSTDGEENQTDKACTSHHSANAYPRGNGGYGAIVEGMAKPFREKIRLNSRVTCIDYSGENASIDDENDDNHQMKDIRQQQQFSNIENNGEDHNIIVTYQCETTSTITRIRAKHVLCTLPLGVLQQPSTMNMFRPPLPMEKVTSINKLGIGHYNKCVLYWQDMKDEEIFWPKQIEWLLRLVNPPDDDDGSHDEDARQVNFVDFYNAYPINGGLPLLVGYVAGDDAKEMEDSNDDKIVQCALQCLRNMFLNVPDPTHTIVTRWSNDPYSQGAYSYLKVGSSNEDRKTLAQALPVTFMVNDNTKQTKHDRADAAQQMVKESLSKSFLWFAGEATHTLYPATTHGAMLSGEEVALKILKLMKN